MVTKQSRSERVAAMKDNVRRVAAEQFATRGFISTSVRDIAREAGVDPSQITRYFGSKEGLFLQTMALPDGWANALAGPLETLAADYMRFILDLDRNQEGGAILAALVRASDRPEVAESLRAHTQTIFEEGLLPRLSGNDAGLRAHLFAAGMTGLQIALWVSPDPTVTEAASEDLVRLFAPSLQLLLTPGR